MKIIKIDSWLTVFLLFLCPFMGHTASIPSWQLTPAESSLTFTATQNGAPVTGEFKTFTGQILFSLSDLKHSQATITIDISSLSASYRDLTTTLMTPEWFNAKVFPKAVFKSTGFTQVSDKTFQATGFLTIKDKTAPVTLTFTAVEPKNNQIIVDGTTSINRSTFGVGQGEWASTKEIKDEVMIHFKLVAKGTEQ